MHAVPGLSLDNQRAERAHEHMCATHASEVQARRAPSRATSAVRHAVVYLLLYLNEDEDCERNPRRLRSISMLRLRAVMRVGSAA